MRETHASVAALRGRLWAAVQAEGAEAPSELQRELEALGPERAAGLAELVEARRAALLGEQLPGGSSLCEAISELWGTAQEDAAERQLLSFAAAAAATPAARGRALLATSVTERLSAALCALREEQRRLAAVLSLRGVAG